MRYPAILAACLLLLLAACQYLPAARTEPKPVQVGTEGIAVSFLPRAPPSQVYENERFPVQLVLENKGTEDMRGGVYVLNYEAGLLGVTPSSGRFDLRGRSTLSPVGDKRTFSHDGRAGDLDPEFQFRDTNLIASICYPYRTDATLITCVDTDLLGRQKNKPCTPASQGFSGGQGAPVAITRITPEMLPHESPELVKPRFTVEIENVGTGEIVDVNRFSAACGATLPRDAQNVISVHAALSDEPLFCTPDRIDPGRGQNKIICIYEEGIHFSSGTYPAPLRVELEYGYVQNIFTPVRLVQEAGLE
jgi:hypothetical protein